jgi:DNA polymerase III subunit epsilon
MMKSLRLDMSAGLPSCFVALDFETADRSQDSACAIGMVRVEGSVITQRRYRLLRPPRPHFVFTYVHGITWADVVNEPTFAEAWPSLSGFLEGAAFLAAHNSPFDRGVLEACCRSSGLTPPGLPFVCTMQLARKTWGIRRAGLDAVCRRLRVPLNHHHAASDAEACAQIVLAACRKASEAVQEDVVRALKH